jgi:hypothetical protein
MTQKIDLRTKAGRAYKLEAKLQKKKEFKQWIVSAVILGFLAGAVLTSTLWQTFNEPKVTPQASPEALKQTIEVKAVEDEPEKQITWNDAIREIFPEDEAGRMIRICLKESGRKYAINWNTNGSYDYSWCQINSVHKPRNMSDEEWKTNLDDPRFHAQQVRKIYLSQGWNAWVVYTKGIVQ